jgi:ABC-type multidrug transport system fused ATPase/permease subunit
MFSTPCVFGVNNNLEQKVLIDLRGDLHSRLLDLPVGYYDKRQTGEIASRVIEDVQNVERALLDGTEQGTVSLMTLIGISAILFVQQPLLAAMVLAPLPLVIYLGRLHFKASRRLWRDARNAAGALNGLLMENISGHRLISSFALGDRERGRFGDAARKVQDTTLRAMYRWSLHGPGTNFLSSLGAVAVVGVGGALLMESQATGGAFSFGDFVSFFAYAALVYEPVSRLNQLNQMLAAAKASSDRVFEILDHPLEIEPPENPQSFPEGVPRRAIRKRQLRLPGSPGDYGGLRPRIAGGKSHGPSRPHRRRQDHLGQPDVALLRRHVGSGVHWRRECARARPDGSPPTSRTRRPGTFSLQWYRR